MPNNIIAIFKKEDEIKKLIDKVKQYSFGQLKKHKHFEFSIIEKITDINLIRETFSKTELIKSIEFRENDKGQRYYSFNYELDNKTFIVIALTFETEPPTIINGFHAKRNYKQFEKSLMKNYKTKII